MSAPDSGPLAQVTAADVLRWGRAQPADSVVGVCRNPRACLIASYALRVLGKGIDVSPGSISGDYRLLGTTHLFDLPDDLNALAADFDDLSQSLDESARLMHPADLDRLEATP